MFLKILVYSQKYFLHDRLDEALTAGKDFCLKLRHLGLLPHPKSDIYGFSPDEINDHYSKVFNSDSENLDDVTGVIMLALDDGFKFHEVALNDVILAAVHFKS